MHPATMTVSQMFVTTASRRCLHTTMVSMRDGERGMPATLSKKEIERQVRDESKGVFRVLDIGKPKPVSFKKKDFKSRSYPARAPPREKLMKPDQDWTSVWPATRTFHPAVVPLPIRQGLRLNPTDPTPSKWANAELMKVPNFLHLTPPTIQKHCEELKKFCTEFPPELENEDEMELNLPLTEISSDYLNASSSIRDNRSRIVSLQFRLSGLRLSARARDKFLRLVGESERYDYTTDVVTISSDRLPHRKQNRQYCEYLIKALYFESNKVEDWESEREECDDQFYQLRIEDETSLTPQQLEHKKSLQTIFNQGEDPRTVDNYKSKVRQMLGLSSEIPVAAEQA